MPALPDAHAGAIILLTVLALVAFTRDSIPLETTSLAILSILTVGFSLFPYHGEFGHVEIEKLFSGFGHEALIAVCGLMMAGQGLVRTGALEPVGRVLARMWGKHPNLSLLLTLVIGALLSAFVNNTPIVVLLLPILTSASIAVGSSASKVLMPVGFATLVGGMGTTIGTSTNLLVVAVAADLGLERFGMFDFFAPAAIAAAVAIVFLWLVAPRMLPERETPMADTSPRVFDAALRVGDDSSAIDATLKDLTELSGGRMRVKRVRRRGTDRLPFADFVIRAGDELMVRGRPDQLKEYERLTQTELHSGDPDDDDGATRIDDDNPLSQSNEHTAEIVIQPGSLAVGLTVHNMGFAEHYGLAVIGVFRGGQELRGDQRYYDVRLEIGDVLLMQGSDENIQRMKQEEKLLVLDATSELMRTEKAPVALAIMAAIVASAAFGVVGIEVAAVAGTLLMILTGCMNWRSATAALNTQIILIVAASLALGYSLQETGGAHWLTQVFLAVTDGSSPRVVISGLMLVMAVLTNVVSNNAAAVIGTPIAFGIATELGLPPEPFVLAVLFGANMSYATPMAYKTNLLVMTAGGYAFSDFVKIGVPLTALVWLTLSFVLPWMYGI